MKFIYSINLEFFFHQYDSEEIVKAGDIEF